MANTNGTPVNINGFSKYGSSYVAVEQHVNRLSAGIYTVDLDMRGAVHYHQEFPPLDQLILFPDSDASRVIGEFERFQQSEPLYAQLGFVHKRGFLLYGPPGNGKTSLIYQIADLFSRGNDGIVIRAKPGQRPSVVALAIEELRRAEETRPMMVVFEEVEVTYTHYGSELLELLDGGRDVRHVFFVASTNYLDKLDPRLSERPSRFDTKLEVLPPNEAVRTEYLLRKGLDRSKCEEIARACEGLSFSHLKEFLVAHVIMGQSLEAIRERFVHLREKADEDEGDPMVDEVKSTDEDWEPSD